MGRSFLWTVSACAAVLGCGAGDTRSDRAARAARDRPHRARVGRGRDDFAKAANLDAKQQAELEAAVQDAASQIQDRLLGAALGGEFSPQTFKPMTGVTLAREVLEIVERANQRFVGSLRDDQRTAMARPPFDFGDYLVFATRWEDALGYSDK